MELLKYHGVDWMAMILTLLGNYNIGNKKKHGFILMMIGNSIWIILGVIIGSFALVIANIAFISVNLSNFIKWQKQEIS